MKQDDDMEPLLRAAARGEPRGQELLYQYCYPYGITVALYYSGTREEAEEILQDSFVKLFRVLGDGEMPAVFKPWFRKMIINTAIDHYRRKTSRLRLDRLLPRTAVSNDAITTLNNEDFYKLLQQLPRAYRIVFSLHVLENLPHAEIAQRLGISVGTSKSNLFKARRKLQRLAAPFFSLDLKLTNA